MTKFNEANFRHIVLFISKTHKRYHLPDYTKRKSRLTAWKCEITRNLNCPKVSKL